MAINNLSSSYLNQSTTNCANFNTIYLIAYDAFFALRPDMGMNAKSS